MLGFCSEAQNDDETWMKTRRNNREQPVQRNAKRKANRAIAIDGSDEWIEALKKSAGSRLAYSLYVRDCLKRVSSIRLGRHRPTPELLRGPDSVSMPTLTARSEGSIRDGKLQKKDLHRGWSRIDTVRHERATRWRRVSVKRRGSRPCGRAEDIEGTAR